MREEKLMTLKQIRTCEKCKRMKVRQSRELTHLIISCSKLNDCEQEGLRIKR